MIQYNIQPYQNTKDAFTLVPVECGLVIKTEELVAHIRHLRNNMTDADSNSPFTEGIRAALGALLTSL